MEGLGNDDETDPVFLLRNRLAFRRRSGELGGDTPSARLALCITAWNLFRARKTVKRLIPVKGDRTYAAIT